MKSKIERDGELVFTGTVQKVLEESSKYRKSGKQTIIVHRGKESELYVL